MRPSAVKLRFRVTSTEGTRLRDPGSLPGPRPGARPRTTFYPCRPRPAGHPILYSLCGESRQAREEARPF